MAIKFLQCNVNRSQQAQDLLLGYARETGVDLCIIAEPARRPDSIDWIASRNGLAAIFCLNLDLFAPAGRFRSGEHFVAANLRGLLIVSCYISPNTNRNSYIDFLDDLESAMIGTNGSIILAGDFNAHSVLWGSRLNSGKGNLLREWSAGRDLRLANRGNVPTCVRPQGSSCVDLTWASADLIGQIIGWKVLAGVETLSDHELIRFQVGVGGAPAAVRPQPSRVSWNLKRMDVTSFHSHLDWSCGFGPLEADLETANGPAEWLDTVMREACDFSAPRSGHRALRRKVFWWNEEVAELRVTCERSKRRWRKLRLRRHHLVEEAERSYRIARNSLRYAIKKAKAAAWGELIASIDQDPWGLPYKLVLKRLRRSSPGLTEVFDEVVLKRLLDSLFPPGNPLVPIIWRDDIWNDEMAVTPNEVITAIKSRKRSTLLRDRMVLAWLCGGGLVLPWWKGWRCALRHA